MKKWGIAGSQPPHLFLVARAVQVLGPERCLTLVVEVLTMESHGGLWEEPQPPVSLGRGVLGIVQAAQHTRGEAEDISRARVESRMSSDTQPVNTRLCVPGTPSRTCVTATRELPLHGTMPGANAHEWLQGGTE